MTVERLFLAVPWGCLWLVIVVFPDHTYLLILDTSCPTADPVVASSIPARSRTFVEVGHEKILLSVKPRLH